MDIIEYALSNYTDFLHFEQLCLEVLGYYGYPRIKKVGGYKDDGIDAISSEIYYDETQTKRVFQFTMQKDTKGKVSDTTRKMVAPRLSVFSNIGKISCISDIAQPKTIP